MIFEGRKLHYRAQGNGPIVLMVHAASSSSNQWKLLTNELSDRFTVIAPDLHGYGKSEQFAGSYLEQEPADIRFLQQILNQYKGPVHLVGHSHGGRIIARMIAEGFIQPTSITLFEPTIFHLLHHLGETAAWHEVTELANTIISFCENEDYYQAADTFISYWIAPGALDKFPEHIRTSTINSMVDTANGWRAVIDIESQPTASDYAMITAPTLLLRGHKSPNAINRVMHVLDNLLPNSKQVAFNIGHMGPVTHPQDINPIIVEHILNHSQAPQ